MSMAVSRRQTPEERELQKKEAEFARLENELAHRELDIETLKAELRAFERRYLSVVGLRYAELDEIEAQIAEAQVRSNPLNPSANARAEQARAQARDSSEASMDAGKGPQKFEATDSLKRLWREASKRIHPDLVTDPAERARRNKTMAEVNRAYSNGDEARLRDILRGWEESPESVQGEGTAAELIRIIRKIAQIETRLQTIAAELALLRASELFQLKSKVEVAELYLSRK